MVLSTFFHQKISHFIKRGKNGKKIYLEIAGRRK